MARLLQRQGYAATGLNQVVAESGGPKGSMCFPFPNGKEELATEAVAGSGALIAAVLQHHVEGHLTTIKAIERFIDALIGQLERSDFLDGCPIATVALEVAPTSDTIGLATKDAFESWIVLIAQRFEREGRSRAESHSLATLVVAAIEGGLVLSKAGRDAAPLRTVQFHLPRLCT